MDTIEKVRRTIKRFNLIEKGDKVAVACSGGKDSTSLVYILKRLGYNIEVIFIDLGIGESSKMSKEIVKRLCERLDVKLHTIELKKIEGLTLPELYAKKGKAMKMGACAMCGVLKRYHLNKGAREIGATKLATGHNLDDEVENIFLNIFGGNKELILALGPTSKKITNKKFVKRIKPLYLCTNKEMKQYAEQNKIEYYDKRCPMSTLAFRGNVRGFIRELEEYEPRLKENVVEWYLKERERIEMEESKSGVCKKCGEPSKNEICMRCKIVE